MIIQYNNNDLIDYRNVNDKINIFGLCDITNEKINNSFNNIIPDFILSSNEDENNIILKVSNKGYNGFGKLSIFTDIFSRNFKNNISIYETIEDSIILSKSKYIYNLENLDTHFEIEPVLFKNDIIEIKFNKLKIAKQINSFNENITVNFYVNIYKQIKETDYNNSTSITIYVEK